MKFVLPIRYLIFVLASIMSVAVVPAASPSQLPDLSTEQQKSQVTYIWLHSSNFHDRLLLVGSEWDEEIEKYFENHINVYIDAFAPAYEGQSIAQLDWGWDDAKHGALAKFTDEEARKIRLRDFVIDGLTEVISGEKYLCSAMLDGKCVGFIWIKLNEDDSSVYIGCLAVSPLIQRHGIGAGLVGEVLKLGATHISVATRKENVRAAALYKKLGFTESKEVPEGLVADIYIGFELRRGA